MAELIEFENVEKKGQQTKLPFYGSNLYKRGTVINRSYSEESFVCL